MFRLFIYYYWYACLLPLNVYLGSAGIKSSAFSKFFSCKKTLKKGIIYHRVTKFTQHGKI